MRRIRRSIRMAGSSVEKRGSSGPFFADVSLHFDDIRHMLVANDGYGRQQWEVSLAGEGQRQNFGYNRVLSMPAPRPPAAGRAGLEDHGDRHAGVRPPTVRRGCCGRKT